MNFTHLSRLEIFNLVNSYKNAKWWTGFDNEDTFDRYEKIKWMQDNWMVSVYAAIFYVVIIFGLREWMKTRPAFELKGPLILWNLSLAIFSIKGASVLVPEILRLVQVYGYHVSACGTVDLGTSKSLYWGFLFIYSKMAELGDTLFIVLRKRPLIFLHWYHHVSVLILVWIGAGQIISTSAWAATLNYTVHAFMYSYFTITALGLRVPKMAAMFITILQLTQFVIGLGIYCYGIGQKWAGNDCGVTDFYMCVTILLGFSYFVLFANFFYFSYFSIAKKTRKIKAQ